MKSKKVKIEKKNDYIISYNPYDNIEDRRIILRKQAVLIGPEKLIKLIGKLAKKETSNSKIFSNISKDKLWLQKNYGIKQNNNINRSKKSKRSKRCRRGQIV